MVCYYSNSEFSSTWSTDIIENGPYNNMRTSGGHTYHNDGEHGMPFGPKNAGNFYIKRFFEWWDTGLRESLDELRVSGGEPSRSPHFWQLVSKFNNERFRFAVNSNLMMEPERLQRLIDIHQQFRRYDIYTSGEAGGKTGEFTRRGVNYEQWWSNLKHINQVAPQIHTHIMMTVSALSVWGISQFLDDVMLARGIAKTSGSSVPYHMSVNILRFPSFQSVNVIDVEHKNQLADDIQSSIDRSTLLTDSERNSFMRLVEYLRAVDRGYEDVDSNVDKRNDFREFVKQYSSRSGMAWDQHMPATFNEWFNTL